ncbi:hypothetical protein niasHS_000887 [Heterodera schachtii]|uniref:Uncharacterized protein n=1 Tax=Heterodera schachtii TaxID=97005 RepID=A0ABD2KIH3_HETSC
MAVEFMQKIKRVPNWADRIHFIAVTHLIDKFDEFAHFMCHGNGEITVVMVKERLIYILPTKRAFNAIEAQFPEIMNYPCDSENELENALQLQRKISGAHHLEFLNRLLQPKPENEWFLAKIIAIPGARTRLIKMIHVQQTHEEDERGQQYKDNYIKNWSSEMRIGQAIMELWDQRFTNENDLFNNANLLSLYNGILFGEPNNLLCRTGELFKADIVVFAQWMDDKIGTARHTIANKRIANQWKMQREILNDVFELIEDEDSLTQRKKRITIGPWFLKMKQNFMEANKNKSAVQKLDLSFLEVWDINTDPSDINVPIIRQYKKWIGQLHKNAIIRLSGEDKVFAERLKKG